MRQNQQQQQQEKSKRTCNWFPSLFLLQRNFGASDFPHLLNAKDFSAVDFYYEILPRIFLVGLRLFCLVFIQNKQAFFGNIHERNK